MIEVALKSKPETGAIELAIGLRSGRSLLGICFWRKVREERVGAEYMAGKGGWGERAAGSSFEIRILSGDFIW